MILILSILFFLLILSSFLTLILISTLKIEVSALNIDTNRIKNEKVKNNYEIKISINIFNCIKWMQISINSKKISKIRRSVKFNKLKIKFIKNIFNNKKNFIDIKQIKLLKQFHLDLDLLKLYITFNTEDVRFTSYLTTLLSSIIAILIANSMKEYRKDKYQFLISPKYDNSNFLKLNLNCIINVKMVHIINVIYIILRKRSEVKNAKSSDRRTYDYSHE